MRLLLGIEREEWCGLTIALPGIDSDLLWSDSVFGLAVCIPFMRRLVGS